MRLLGWLSPQSKGSPDPDAKPDDDRRIRIAPVWTASDLTEQQLLNHDAVQTVANLWVSTVAGGGWKLTGADADRLAPYAAELFDRPDFEHALDAIIKTSFTRCAVIQMPWDTTSRPWRVRKYEPLPLASVSFEFDDTGDVLAVRATTSAGIQTLDIPSSIVARHFPTIDNPLGSSLLDYLKPRIDQLQDVDHALAEFIVSHSVPGMLVKYPKSWSASDREAAFREAKKYRRTGVLMVPHDADVTLLNTPASAGISVAIQKRQMDERSIARLVFGAVLAIYEAEFGTRAQSDTHADVMMYAVRRGQRFPEQVIDQQVWQPFVRWNLGQNIDARFELNEPNYTDIRNIADALSNLSLGGFLTDADRENARTALLPQLGIEVDPASSPTDE